HTRFSRDWSSDVCSSDLRHAVVAGPDSTLQSQPARAIAKACEREGVDPKDLDLVEINEAFAAVGIVSVRELGIDPAKVNVNGGRSAERRVGERWTSGGGA